MPSNSCPFALQKDPFCSPKGLVLQPKRTPFQNDRTEGVSKVTAVRPEGAEALIINAFALAGRFAIFNPYTQGAALGYVLLGLSARFV